MWTVPLLRHSGCGTQGTVRSSHNAKTPNEGATAEHILTLYSEVRSSVAHRSGLRPHNSCIRTVRSLHLQLAYVPHHNELKTAARVAQKRGIGVCEKKEFRELGGIGRVGHSDDLGLLLIRDAG